MTFVVEIGRIFPGEPPERMGGVVSRAGNMLAAAEVVVAARDVVAAGAGGAGAELLARAEFALLFGWVDVDARAANSFIFASVCGPTVP